MVESDTGAVRSPQQAGGAVGGAGEPASQGADTALAGGACEGPGAAHLRVPDQQAWLPHPQQSSPGPAAPLLSPQRPGHLLFHAKQTILDGWLVIHMCVSVLTWPCL